MSNIEEDIKKVKELNSLLKFFKTHGWIPNLSRTINTNGTIDAIENILAEREADKKRIKELEEERQLVGMPVKNKRDERIGVVLHQWKNGSVAVLENINPRIINTHDSWNTLEIVTDEVKQTKTKDKRILRQKIIDKMEKLNKEIKNCNEIEAIFKIKQQQILQELLEDK